LKSGKDRADKRTVHGTSHEILSALKAHTASYRNLGSLYTCNHIQCCINCFNTWMQHNHYRKL